MPKYQTIFQMPNGSYRMFTAGSVEDIRKIFTVVAPRETVDFQIREVATGAYISHAEVGRMLAAS